MAPKKAIIFCFWVFSVLEALINSSSYAVAISHASAVERVIEICSKISSQHLAEQELTFVFVLHLTLPVDKSLFNFLWRLPRAQVYSANRKFHLKGNEREVVISWQEPKVAASGVRWDLRSSCGYKNCVKDFLYIEEFAFEKRALIQIANCYSEKFDGQVQMEIFHAISGNLLKDSYFQRYRSSFVVVRRGFDDSLLATFVVQGVDHTADVHVSSLVVRELGRNEAGGAFALVPSLANRSMKFELNSTSISSAGSESTVENFVLRSCGSVSTRLTLDILV